MFAFILLTFFCCQMADSKINKYIFTIKICKLHIANKYNAITVNSAAYICISCREDVATLNIKDALCYWHDDPAAKLWPWLWR